MVRLLVQFGKKIQSLIHTGLEPGEAKAAEVENRFNGLLQRQQPGQYHEG